MSDILEAGMVAGAGTLTAARGVGLAMKNLIASMLLGAAIESCNFAAADEINSQQQRNPWANLEQNSGSNAQVDQNRSNAQMQSPQPRSRGYYKARTAPMPNAYRNSSNQGSHAVAPQAPRETPPDSVMIDQARTQDLSLPDDPNQTQSAKTHRGGGWKNLMRRGVSRIPIH